MDEPWIVLPAGAYVVPIPVGIMGTKEAGDRDVQFGDTMTVPRHNVAIMSLVHSPEQKRGNRAGRWWWRHTRHREATAVEQIVPFVFVVVYLVLLTRVVVQ